MPALQTNSTKAASEGLAAVVVADTFLCAALITIADADSGVGFAALVFLELGLVIAVAAVLMLIIGLLTGRTSHPLRAVAVVLLATFFGGSDPAPAQLGSQLGTLDMNIAA